MWPDESKGAEDTEQAQALAPSENPHAHCTGPDVREGQGPWQVATLVPFLFKHHPSHPARGLVSTWPTEAL